MRLRSLLLVILLATLPGGIVTYRDFPNATLESLPKDHEPKPFSYDLEPIPTAVLSSSSEVKDGGPGGNELGAAGLIFMFPNWYPLAMNDFREAGRREVQRTLETSGFFSELTVGGSSPPETGTYCDIHFTDHGPSRLAGWIAIGQMLPGVIVWPLAPILAWGAIPYYSEEGGLSVEYRLYRDGTHRHTYQYEFKKKGVGGLLFLPFAWLNFFTNDLKVAVRGTTLQFLIDAQRDGNL